MFIVIPCLLYLSKCTWRGWIIILVAENAIKNAYILPRSCCPDLAICNEIDGRSIEQSSTKNYEWEQKIVIMSRFTCAIE